MLSEIVVPLDQFERSGVVLDVAAAVARRAGAPLRVVTVASPSMDHMRDEVELHRLAAGVDAPDVRTEVIESNDVVPALLDTAGSDGLLCVETRARGPIGTSCSAALPADCCRTRAGPCSSWGPRPSGSRHST